MKTVPVITAVEAAEKIANGSVIIAGGFGMTGNPVHLLHALAETDTNELTYIGNNVGEPGLGGGRLLCNGQIKKAVGLVHGRVPLEVSGNIHLDNVGAYAQSGVDFISCGAITKHIQAIDFSMRVVST